MATRKYRGPLTEKEKTKIKDRFLDGVEAKELAAQFGVSRSTIYDVTSTTNRPGHYQWPSVKIKTK